VLDNIIRTVLEALRGSTQQYGVYVRGMSIGTIEIEETENVGKAYFAALGAEWKKRMALTEAAGEEKVFEDRAKIQQRLLDNMSGVLEHFRIALIDMSQSGIDMSAEVVERYLQVSENLLQNVVTDHSTARRYLETMKSLAQVNPSTIIAAGMDVANLTDFLLPGNKPAADTRPHLCPKPWQ